MCSMRKQRFCYCLPLTQIVGLANHATRPEQGRATGVWRLPSPSQEITRGRPQTLFTCSNGACFDN